LEILFTEAAVVIGLVYIYLPYTMVPIYASIERLETSVLEAAENLGAGPVERFLRVVLPLIRPGIVAGCIITFIPALGEYLVPNLLGGLQGIMFGNLIATAFQSFNWPLGSALSVVMLVSILIVLLALFRLGERGKGFFAEEERA
jgi:spermidine/putrescine transport system permease protein